MSEQLIKIDAQVQQYSDEDFKKIAGSTGFKRIQLYGKSSNIVGSGKFPMGHFGLVDGQEVMDLGSQFDCIVIAWRPKAMRTGETIEILYDPTVPNFQKIVDESEIKDSGCMFGIEYLLWLPEHGYLPFFLNNKSSKYEAPAFKAMIGKAATVKSILIETKRYTWHAPKIIKCTVPFTALPTEDEVRKEITSFNNPQEDEAEMAAEAEKNDRAR